MCFGEPIDSDQDGIVVGSPTAIIKRTLSQSNGIERQSELLDQLSIDELTARRELEQLEITGEIERFVVGEYLIIRTPDSTQFGGQSGRTVTQTMVDT